MVWVPWSLTLSLSVCFYAHVVHDLLVKLFLQDQAHGSGLVHVLSFMWSCSFNFNFTFKLLILVFILVFWRGLSCWSWCLSRSFGDAWIIAFDVYICFLLILKLVILVFVLVLWWCLWCWFWCSYLLTIFKVQLHWWSNFTTICLFSSNLPPSPLPCLEVLI